MLCSLLPLLLLAGCGSTAIELKDGADTGTPDGDADTDTDADTDADTDTDTDTDTEPPEPEPDYTVWDATRNFSYNGYDCEETATETGSALEEGERAYQDLAEFCRDCDYFYEVSVDPDDVCWGQISLADGWRGVVLGDGTADVHFFYEERGELSEYATVEGASFDGSVIQFAYEWYGLDVSGTVTYPMVEPG